MESSSASESGSAVLTEMVHLSFPNFASGLAAAVTVAKTPVNSDFSVICTVIHRQVSLASHGRRQ